MYITLSSMLLFLCDRNALLTLALSLEALVRLRRIHPADLCLALVECALGDETRSIATARRRLGLISGGVHVEESAFYQRLNTGLARVLKTLFQRALEKCNHRAREKLEQLLLASGLADLQAIDASQVSLPISAAEKFPSTSDDKGGIKLTAIISILFQRIQKVTITSARPHDLKVLRLPRWLHGVLLLMDRGYCDKKLFARIEDRKGAFLIRFKRRNHPVITKIRAGLEESFVGEKLKRDLPFTSSVVDLDARFRMDDGSSRIFRIVSVGVKHRQRGGNIEPVELWFATNLRPEQFSAEQIATLYRLRWEVERLFAVLKTVGRLDQLRSANPAVIEVFMYATLLGVVLAMDVCAEMRRVRPDCEPSLQRVTMLLFAYIGELARRIGTREFERIVQSFIVALFREGTNPNPGRPYRANLYAAQIIGALAAGSSSEIP